MGDPSELSKRHAKSQHNRIDFLETDLALCFTFADLVKTELGFTQAQAAASRPLRARWGRKEPRMSGQQRATELINVTKDGYHIHAELRWDWLGDQR
jgi:hypothetical protein